MSLNKVSSSTFATKKTWMDINCNEIKATNLTVDNLEVQGLLTCDELKVGDLTYPNVIQDHGKVVQYNASGDLSAEFQNKMTLNESLPSVSNVSSGLIVPESPTSQIGEFKVQDLVAGRAYKVSFYGEMTVGVPTDITLELLLDGNISLAKTNTVAVPLFAGQLPYHCDMDFHFRTIGATGQVASSSRFTQMVAPPPATTSLTDLFVSNVAIVDTTTAGNLSVRVSYSAPAPTNTILCAGLTFRQTSIV